MTDEKWFVRTRSWIWARSLPFCQIHNLIGYCLAKGMSPNESSNSIPWRCFDFDLVPFSYSYSLPPRMACSGQWTHAHFLTPLFLTHFIVCPDHRLVFGLFAFLLVLVSLPYPLHCSLTIEFAAIFQSVSSFFARFSIALVYLPCRG